MLRILLIIIIFSLTSCGGGGGGDGFIGAARVKVTISPNEIDTGDRTQIVIEIRDVNTNGIILKISFPDSLSYVQDSARLKVKDDTSSINPDFNQNAAGQDFLVYFLPESIFGEDKNGELTLELEAINVLDKGEIEVDADVDDPLIDNSVEFDVNQPEFLAESSAEIKVIG